MALEDAEPALLPTPTNKRRARADAPPSPPTSKRLRKNSVGWNDITIIEVGQGIEGSSVATDGVPLSLSGPVRRVMLRRLDSFERERESGFSASGSPRTSRRSKKNFHREGRMTMVERLKVLSNGDGDPLVTLDDLQHAVRENRTVLKQRLETNKSPLDMDEETHAALWGRLLPARAPNNDANIEEEAPVALTASA